MIRFRQLVDRSLHGILLVPVFFVVAAVPLAIAMARLDADLSDDRLPRSLETTVESARSMLTAIAGGLLTSVTLLLSLLVLAVQLASSQFSPRTVRSWTGHGTQQVAIGLVLGTSVYCLLVLRETRSFGDDGAQEEIVPHLSVLLAVVLGVVSLVTMLYAVNHLTSSLRVGTVARTITDQTLAIVETTPIVRTSPSAGAGAAVGPPTRLDAPAGSVPVTDHQGGWLQQVDREALVEALDDGQTIYVTTTLGEYVMSGAPVAWIDGDPTDDCVANVLRAIALGPERTMQQDVGFGIVQLVDIALRALSPGVNDPNTANEMIMHLGSIVLEIWGRPADDGTLADGSRRVVQAVQGHRDHLTAAFASIGRVAADQPEVVMTLLGTIDALRGESERRSLAGGIESLDDMTEDVIDAFRGRTHDPADRARVEGFIENLSSSAAGD